MLWINKYVEILLKLKLIITVSNGAIILSRNNSASTSYYYGTVRVYYSGWGNICYDNYYSSTDANVICHQLGYTGALTYSRAGLRRFNFFRCSLTLFSVMVLIPMQ